MLRNLGLFRITPLNYTHIFIESTATLFCRSGFATKFVNNKFQCCLKGEFFNPSNARENTRLWFMTEFCSAGDLNRYIIEAQETKTKTQNSETNAQISLQLLEGLKFLHQVSYSSF